MKTPERISVEDFHTDLYTFLKENCTFSGDPNQLPHCKTCDAEIRFTTPYISIHVSDFTNCAGPGVVDRPPLPYCPNCEPPPAESGCVHMSYARLRKILQSSSDLPILGLRLRS